MKVTVLIQTYQHERYVHQAIESALSQETSFPFHIVVGDDCSTDRTRDILTAFAERYPAKIDLLFPRDRQGPNGLFLQLLRAARGEYVALLDGDDFWSSPFKLQTQSDFLDERPRCAICFHDVMRIFEDIPRNPQPYSYNHAGPELRTDDLLRSNFIATCSAMFRRELATDLPGAFSEFVNLDWLLYIKLSLGGSIGYIDEVMGVYREHAAGLWSGRPRTEQLAEDIRAYRFLLGFLPAEYGVKLRHCILIRSIQLTVEQLRLPYDRAVAVLTKDRGFLSYDGRTTYSLLDAVADGVPPGVRTSETLIAELERARRDGAGFLLVPAPNAPLVDEGTTLGRHINSRYRRLWQGDDCTIVDLYAYGARLVALDGTRAARRANAAVGDVSVVIPCFNQAHFLSEALTSVVNQTLAPREIIVVNDGSTDNTPDVAAQFSGVHCISQPNAGLPAARNAGLRHATGEYVVFLDADDRLVTDALDIGVEEFERHPECALVYGHCRFIDAEGGGVVTPSQRLILTDHYPELLAENVIWAPGSVMYRRTIFARVGSFRESLKAAEDYDIYLRIARLAPLACHGRPVVEYRKHTASMSQDPGRMLKYTHKVLQSQWLFTRRASRLRGAYRHGKLIWQHHYGEATVDRMVYDAWARRWSSARRQLAALAIHFPAGCGSAILRCISPRAELPLLRKRIRRRARVSGVSIVAEDLARWVRCVVDAKAPRGSMIAVASGGDATLTSFALHEGRHFPARRDTLRKVFANSASGSQEAPWIWPACEYEFTLHDAENADPIAAVTVHARRRITGRRPRPKTTQLIAVERRVGDERGPILTASPNPVFIGNSHGTTLLSWDTGNGSAGRVVVSVSRWSFDDRALANGKVALAALEGACEDGAEFLVIPESSFWWLRIGSDLTQYVEQKLPCVWSDDWCRMFELPNHG